MTTLELLSHLADLDVKLWLDNEQLRYSAPKDVITPGLRARLVEHKAEIVACLRGGDGDGPVIERVSRDRDLPLSFAQRRLWFIDQLEPGGTAFNIPAAVRLRGPLDVSALRKSIDEVVRRHESLRTRFDVVDGEAVQVIEPAGEVDLEVVDLSRLDEEKREAEVQRLVSAEARGPFDLTRGPLLRVSLLRLGEEEHIALYTMHHIISDAWSMGILVSEVVSLYEAFLAGRSLPLAELPIQYVDYAVWQHEWLQGEVLEEQLSYWKERLGDNPPPLELPTDRSRPSMQTSRGASETLVLDDGLSEELRVLSRREGCTLFVTLLAVFKVLLHRYTGQVDVTVGSPIAGRDRAEVEGLIGFFLNTLALRTDLSGDPMFRELLGRVQDVALGAYAHQSIPFEKLLEVLRPERDLSRTPLFQVFVNMLNVPNGTVELPGLTIEPLTLSEVEAKFDLELYIREQGDEIRFDLVYNVDLFDAATMVRLLNQYRTLLEGVVVNPDGRISDLPLATVVEEQQRVESFNEILGD